MKFIFSLMIILLPSFCPGQAIRSYEQLSDRVNVTLVDGTLCICPLTDNAVRVKFIKDGDARLPELVFTSRVRTPGFTVSDSHSRLEVRLKQMVAVLDKQDGSLSFVDTAGKIFLGVRRLLGRSMSSRVMPRASSVSR